MLTCGQNSCEYVSLKGRREREREGMHTPQPRYKSSSSLPRPATEPWQGAAVLWRATRLGATARAPLHHRPAHCRAPPWRPPFPTLARGLQGPPWASHSPSRGPGPAHSADGEQRAEQAPNTTHHNSPARAPIVRRDAVEANAGRRAGGDVDLVLRVVSQGSRLQAGGLQGVLDLGPVRTCVSHGRSPPYECGANLPCRNVRTPRSAPGCGGPWSQDTQ